MDSAVPRRRIPERLLQQLGEKGTEILMLAGDLVKDLERIITNTEGLVDDSGLRHGLDNCLIAIGWIKKLLNEDTGIDQEAISDWVSDLQEIVNRKEISAVLDEVLEEEDSQKMLQRLESLLQVLNGLESDNEPESNVVKYRRRFRAAVEKSFMGVRAWIEDLWPIVNSLVKRSAVQKNRRVSAKK